MSGKTYIDYNAWLQRCGDSSNLALLWMDIADINTYIQDGEAALQGEWTIDYSDQSDEINRLMEETAVHRTYLNAICEDINAVDEAFKDDLQTPINQIEDIDISKYELVAPQLENGNTVAGYNITKFITTAELDSVTRPDFHSVDREYVVTNIDMLIETGSSDTLSAFTRELLEQDIESWTAEETEAMNKILLYTYQYEDVQVAKTVLEFLPTNSLKIENYAISDDMEETQQDSISPQESAVKILKKLGKSGLDALGKLGSYGKEAALPIALLKNIIDGDGISGKDIGSTIKGMGNSIIGMCDTYAKEAGKWPLTSVDIKGIAGLVDKYPPISIGSAKAGWLGKADDVGTTIWETLKYEISPKVTTEVNGQKVADSLKSGKKVAGWALSLVANGFSNYDEYKEDGISAERAVAETVTETLIDIGKGAAIAAGVAAGFAAVGIAAPVAVVGAVGIGVSMVADFACESLTGKSVTEFASDTILDLASDAGEALTGAVKSAGDAISNWFNKLTSGGDNTPQYAGA